MSIKNLLKSLLVSCLFFMTAGFFSSAQASPRLYFDPSSATITQGTDLLIKVVIDVESNPSFGADAVVNYPAGDLTLKSVANGGFFTDFSYAQSSGRVEMHGYFSNLYQSRTGSDTYALLAFSPIKSSGTGAVNFICDGSGNDTEILNSSGDNILSCSSLNLLTLSYSSTSDSSSDESTSDSDSPTNGCGGTCGSNYNCNSGLYCYQGFCRNPLCSSETDCICSTPTPTPKPTNKPSSLSKVKSTPQVVALAKATPSPPPTLEESPLEAEPQTQDQEEKGSSFGSIPLWTAIILGGILIVAVAFVIIKKIKKGKEEPPVNNPPTEFGNIKTYKVDPPFENINQTPQSP